ncbi:MAG: thiamine phosphate synthase [Deltaproteobacteria bacterium]|nr:thiamine phosphate synthase [Deltaproteobacteria bacterium]
MKNNFGLYLVITNPVAGYEDCTKAAVENRVLYIQLRMKNAMREEVVQVGKKLRAITDESETKLIINDDVIAARMIDADGVHLGQTDINIIEARKLWITNKPKIFGLSTHNETQAQAAQDLPLDYIGIGPVFTTPTKQIPDPVVGINRVAAIIKQSKLPCVAIGGIDAQRLPKILSADVNNFAVVRYVCASNEPSLRIKELMNIWQYSQHTKNAS